MKLLCTTAFLLLFSISVSAQFQKGDRFINGYVGIASERRNDNNGDLSMKYLAVSVGPSASFFVKDNLAIGAGLNYGYNRNETVPTAYVNKSHSLGANIFGRKYFGLGDNLAIILTGNLRTNLFKYANGPSESEGFGIGVNVQPGLVFLMNPNWSIDLNLGSMGFNFTRNTTTQANSNEFDLNAGSLNLGWTYYLRN